MALFDKITSKLVDFILFVYTNGYVTRSNQNIIKGTMFYLLVWELRDKGILVYDGIVNGRKAWKLSGKGEELAKIFSELRKKGFI